MTHEEFMRLAIVHNYTHDMLSRLAVEKLQVPASWCRKILEDIPEARDYLKQRSPETMAVLEQAERQKREAETEAKMTKKKTTKAMDDAINFVMNKVHEWEMTAEEKRCLKLAMDGNRGALCDLLASLCLTQTPEVGAFYDENNTLPEE